MYEENRTGFILKDILLQIILVVIFVFLLLWLFPTKGYVNNKIDNSLNPVYQELFNSHLNSMKEAAQSYYTTSRLPKKVGDKVSITLGEMLDKKLISTFVDSNNKQCNLNASYVEITKMDDEYMMKVNLSCSDKSDYIIVYLGCYDYCENGLCEKEESTNNSTTVKPSSNNNTTYKYEYVLKTDAKYTSWSNWSSWSTNKILVETDLREVDIRTVKKLVSTDVNYKKAQIIDYDTKEYSVKTTVECPEGYTRHDPNNSNSKICFAPANSTTGSTSTVSKYVDAVATTVKVCPDGSTPINDYCPSTVTTQDVKPAKPYTVYGSWSSPVQETYDWPIAQAETETAKFEYVTQKHVLDCTNNCKSVLKYTYNVSTRTKSTQYSCAEYPGYNLSGTNCVKDVTSGMVHVYGIWTLQTKYTCENGATPVNGKCPVYTSTSSTKCPNGGIFDSTTGVCYTRGQVVSSCPKGIDGEVVDGKCIVEIPEYGCKKGEYNKKENQCKITEYEYDYVTQYRYRTRDYASTKPETVWSYSKNDKDLLNKGYVLTGNKEKVK